jgi:hypothetical protein
MVNIISKKMVRNKHSGDKIQAGLVLHQGYDPEKLRAT